MEWKIIDRFAVHLPWETGSSSVELAFVVDSDERKNWVVDYRS